MRCLLDGTTSERFEILIPHGKITIETNNTSPNYNFFLREFFKEINKKARMKYGNCHLGEGTFGAVDTKAEGNHIGSGLGSWVDQVGILDFYMTNKGKLGVYVTLKGKEFRKTRNRHKDVMRDLFVFLEKEQDALEQAQAIEAKQNVDEAHANEAQHVDDDNAKS